MHMSASCRCCGWACKLLVDVGPISRTFLPLLRDRDVYVTTSRAVEMKENVNELNERYSHEYGRRRIGKLRFPKGWGRPLLSFSLFRKQPDCLTACGRTVDCHEGISWGYRYVAWAVGRGRRDGGRAAWHKCPCGPVQRRFRCWGLHVGEKSPNIRTLGLFCPLVIPFCPLVRAWGDSDQGMTITFRIGSIPRALRESSPCRMHGKTSCQPTAISP
ncbi:hypothetical protein BDP55DRAFT_362067 [Colletotrichum godetiae]|uniref:Uncharacterized protein n=1 Tax=Colletotrichum godetiae TaxID=1209918 RepID=A0AAJ0AA17_9PEZI|nr:uncharacterized protein BDP55DRAFT_362067 [Colletotrichum godetiae]KAK1659304.1 hypothetical protein BDP55DRAFT_362067 [Colletotrichum godetiae]